MTTKILVRERVRRLAFFSGGCTLQNSVSAARISSSIPTLSSNFYFDRRAGLTTSASVSSVARASSTAFPSIKISQDGISANGTFAEAQVNYLSPHSKDVSELDDALAAAKLGVTAHYYMDPEVQGLISAVNWPHVTISDSLAMGEAAVKMVREGGVEAIACLGVDFMAESVRATLDKEGISDVPVYRLAQNAIGCSLAESAESPAYRAWLLKAAARARTTATPALHVVYINTSLVTKAESQALVPTIACTSSNVVQTILQAFAQVPDLTIWYGPDTYMGDNLRRLFSTLADTMDDETIKRTLHPAHSKKSLLSMLERFEVFPQGNCVVHHMFGGAVAEKVRVDHADAYVTAHLEVPGEMFDVANEKAASGMGVVGSTSNILNFIIEKTKDAVSNNSATQTLNKKKVSFVLGTEAGMITPIVRQVQAELRRGGVNSKGTEIEIVFPVAADAVTGTGNCVTEGLAVVPGTSGGEGCSAAGGCASCPYMKMNDIDRLLNVANKLSASKGATETMDKYLPLRRDAKVNGEPAGLLGTVPITHMRHFTRSGELSEGLISDLFERAY